MKLNLPSRQPLGELVCAACLLAFGAFIVIDGLQYPLIVDDVVGPGLMPLVSGLTLTGVSAWLVAKSMRPAASAADDPPETKDGGENLSIADFSEEDGEAAGKPITVIGILALLVMAALLAPLFGLLPMLGFLVFACVFWFEREGLLTATLMSIGAMTAGWVVFGLLFEVPLPMGSVWQVMGR